MEEEKKEVYGRVYGITCRINGKQYVGQTIKKVSYRFNEHARANSPLGEDIRKYGRKNFEIEVLEECYSFEELNAAEMKWIKIWDCKVPKGYNRTDGGEGILNPVKDTREKIAAASMGNQYALGRKHTEDEKRRIRESNLGQKRSPETRERVRQAKLGTKASDETKAKMSAKRKGRKFSEEHKRKISEARKAYWASIKPEDRKLSDERKAQLSAKNSGSNNPSCKPENAKKISEGLNRYHSKKRVAKANVDAAASLENFETAKNFLAVSPTKNQAATMQLTLNFD